MQCKKCTFTLCIHKHAYWSTSVLFILTQEVLFLDWQFWVYKFIIFNLQTLSYIQFQERYKMSGCRTTLWHVRVVFCYWLLTFDLFDKQKTDFCTCRVWFVPAWNQILFSMAARPEKSVLSIQSTVVFGYVGNKSATFPLQVFCTWSMSNFLCCIICCMHKAFMRAKCTCFIIFHIFCIGCNLD